MRFAKLALPTALTPTEASALMNSYYVYQLIDPRSGSPFYIGKGARKRAWSHLEFKSGCDNPHKDRIIKKIRSQGLEPVIDYIHQDLTEDEAYDLEEELIETIGLENLSNICKDRRPPICIGKKNGFFGKTHTYETKKRLGAINRGKDLKSAEGKKAIADRQRELWADPDERAKKIEKLKSRKGEKRSPEAIQSYRNSAAERNARMTPEERSARTIAGVETKKKKYAGLRRKKYIDEEGKTRFRWIPE